MIGCIGVLSRAINSKFFELASIEAFLNHLQKVTMSYLRYFFGHFDNYI